MMEVCNWLPQNAIFDGKVSNLLNEVVAKWGVKWIAIPSQIDTNIVFSNDGPAIVKGDHVWESSDRELVTWLANENRNYLAEALIGKSIPVQKVSRSDMSVLEQLTTACLDDLHSSLIDTLDIDDEYEEYAVENSELSFDRLSYDFCIKLNNEIDVVRICISENLIALIRKKLVSVTSEACELGSIKDAVSLQTISIGARVGKSKLGLSEIKKLSQGDVVVLDSDLGAPMGLTLNNNMTSSLYCKVVQDKGDPNLKLTQICDANH